MASTPLYIIKRPKKKKGKRSDSRDLRTNIAVFAAFSTKNFLVSLVHIPTDLTETVIASCAYLITDDGIYCVPNFQKLPKILRSYEAEEDPVPQHKQRNRVSLRPQVKLGSRMKPFFFTFVLLIIFVVR